MQSINTACANREHTYHTHTTYSHYARDSHTKKPTADDKTPHTVRWLKNYLPLASRYRDHSTCLLANCQLYVRNKGQSEQVDSLTRHGLCGRFGVERLNDAEAAHETNPSANKDIARHCKKMHSVLVSYIFIAPRAHLILLCVFIKAISRLCVRCVLFRCCFLRSTSQKEFPAKSHMVTHTGQCTGLSRKSRAFAIAWLTTVVTSRYASNARMSNERRERQRRFQSRCEGHIVVLLCMNQSYIPKPLHTFTQL